MKITRAIIDRWNTGVGVECSKRVCFLDYLDLMMLKIGGENLMLQFAIIDAPSILGLRPTGVEHLPEALRAAGLLTHLRAEYAGRISSLPYNPNRDKSTLLLNPEANFGLATSS